MEGLELTPEEEEGDAQVMALGDLRTKEGKGGGGGGGEGEGRVGTCVDHSLRKSKHQPASILSPPPHPPFCRLLIPQQHYLNIESLSCVLHQLKSFGQL